MPVSDAAGLTEILKKQTVAVIGCSTTPGKAAHEVPAYLQRHGYTIIPVNPYADEILGVPAVESLADIDSEIDVVDVFRPSEEVAGIVDSVLDRHEARGDVDTIWLQLGIHDDDAVAKAEAAGLTVVEDRCMKVEHGLLLR